MARRDLYVTTYAPQLENGRALRTYTLVRALAAAGPVDVAYVPFGGEGPSPEFLAIPGSAYHRVIPSRGFRRAATYADRRVRGAPASLARGVSPELTREVARLATAAGRGRVIAGDLTAMTAMLGLARTRPVVYSAHNVESAFTDPIHGGALARRMVARLERRVLRVAAEAWMVSETDLERAARLHPGARLRYVPNVVDATSIEPLAPVAGNPTAVMVGDFHWPPNRDGLRWLQEEVLPAVGHAVPRVAIRVVGRGLDPVQASDPRLDPRGFVADLRDAYTGAGAVVVPLVESGGTPLKLIEAMAYGLPVVATGRAVQGLAVRHGEHLRVADAPADFARELADLLQNGDPAMARRARALVEEAYSVEALTRLVADQDP